MTDLSGIGPSGLVKLWHAVERGEVGREDHGKAADALLADYRRRWQDALLAAGESDLARSILVEIGRYRGIADLAAVRAACDGSLAELKRTWLSEVGEGAAAAVARYYDTSDRMIEELMWWHRVEDDTSPLSYVAALDVALAHPGRGYLDFGSGVGSGGLLFAAAGFRATLADISTVLQDFCRWRLAAHDRAAALVDLKAAALPDRAFDFVTAMDVFEHLSDPVGAVEKLDRALKPGGVLFGRFAGDDDDDRPQHIVHDFAPVFRRLDALGYRQIWEDKWFWGHQAFRKPE
jgi:SAM-dependent methyltransferase